MFWELTTNWWIMRSGACFLTHEKQFLSTSLQKFKIDQFAMIYVKVYLRPPSKGYWRNSRSEFFLGWTRSKWAELIQASSKDKPASCPSFIDLRQGTCPNLCSPQTRIRNIDIQQRYSRGLQKAGFEKEKTLWLQRRSLREKNRLQSKRYRFLWTGIRPENFLKKFLFHWSLNQTDQRKRSLTWLFVQGIVHSVGLMCVWKIRWDNFHGWNPKICPWNRWPNLFWLKNYQIVYFQSNPTSILKKRGIIFLTSPIHFPKDSEMIRISIDLYLKLSQS